MEQEPLGLGRPVGAYPPGGLLDTLEEPIHDCLWNIPSPCYIALLVKHLDDFVFTHEVMVLLDVGELLRGMVPVELQCKFNVVLLL